MVCAEWAMRCAAEPVCSVCVIITPVGRRPPRGMMARKLQRALLGVRVKTTGLEWNWSRWNLLRCLWAVGIDLQAPQEVVYTKAKPDSSFDIAGPVRDTGGWCTYCTAAALLGCMHHPLHHVSAHHTAHTPVEPRRELRLNTRTDTSHEIMIYTSYEPTPGRGRGLMLPGGGTQYEGLMISRGGSGGYVGRAFFWVGEAV